MIYFITIICYVIHNIIIFIVVLYWRKWFWAIRRLVHPSFSYTKLNKISTSNIEPLGSILHIDIMYVHVYYVGKRICACTRTKNNSCASVRGGVRGPLGNRMEYIRSSIVSSVFETSHVVYNRHCRKHNRCMVHNIAIVDSYRSQRYARGFTT